MRTVDGVTVALAPHDAGHQSGAFVPRLGDRRALPLGEVVGVHGQLCDLHQHAVERLAG